MSPEYSNEDSQARQRSYQSISRQDFASLAERVTVVETRQRIHERQVAKELSEMERRLSEDLSKVEKATSDLNKSVQTLNITLAEMKVKSGLIGVLSSGVTFFLLMGWEWLKQKAQGK